MTTRPDDWEPVSDYDDQMSAVEDGLLSYEDTHCKHGTFTGSWAGPDYMCGPCEMGISDADWEAECKARRDEREWKHRLRQRRPALQAAYRRLADTPGSMQDPWLAARMVRVLTWLFGDHIGPHMRPSQGLRPNTADPDWTWDRGWVAGPNTPDCCPCRSVPPGKATVRDRSNGLWYCPQCHSDIYVD